MSFESGVEVRRSNGWWQWWCRKRRWRRANAAQQVTNTWSQTVQNNCKTFEYLARRNTCHSVSAVFMQQNYYSSYLLTGVSRASNDIGTTTSGSSATASRLRSTRTPQRPRAPCTSKPTISSTRSSTRTWTSLSSSSRSTFRLSTTSTDPSVSRFSSAQLDWLSNA